jgi:hypothetical protein
MDTESAGSIQETTPRDGNHRNRLPRSLLSLACIVLLSISIAFGFFVANSAFVRSQPGGNDFLARWMGARFFLQGISPYDDRVGLETQKSIYGRPADPARGEDMERFVYPLYSMILFAPFAYFDFSTARALWMTLEEFALLAILGLSFKVARYTPPLGSVAGWMLFALTWYFSARALINGNPIILIALFLVGAWLAMQHRRWCWTGFLLALSTIKPQITLLCLVWILCWAAWNHKWNIVAWFCAWMAFFISAAWLIQPQWIAGNWNEIVQYGMYTEPGSPISVLATFFPGTGVWLGAAITSAVWISLLVLWWRIKEANEEGMVWGACMTLALTFWSGIQNDPGNQLILLPALIFFSAWWSIRKGGAFLRDAGFLTVVWIIFWGFFLLTLQQRGQPIQSPWMLFPLPMLCIMGLMIFQPAISKAT